MYAPLLLGHGTSKEDMIKTGRVDRIRGAEEGLRLLQEEGHKKSSSRACSWAAC
ncbi:MAG: hypothetical protein ACUVQY_03065 [Thermoproteota archaeon]